MDTEAPTKAENEVVSIDPIQCLNKQRARKLKKDVQYHGLGFLRLWFWSPLIGVLIGLLRFGQWRQNLVVTDARATYATQGVVFSRGNGRRHLGLKELKPTNPIYWKLSSYRYHRLDDSSFAWSARGTGEFKNCIKRMNTNVQWRYFSEKYPILVVNFGANMICMSEAQAYLTLPYFLSSMA